MKIKEMTEKKNFVTPKKKKTLKQQIRHDHQHHQNILDGTDIRVKFSSVKLVNKKNQIKKR